MAVPRPTLFPAALGLVLSLVLVGCGGDDESATPAPVGPTQDSGCGFQSGPVSNAVTVRGDLGGEVVATFAKPVRPSAIERTVLTTGSGKQPKDGSSVNATVTLLNGNTGAVINRQSNPTTVGDPQTPRVLAAGIGCVPIGSRVVTTAPASELFGPEGNPEVGLAANDGIVIVTDVAAVVKPPQTEGWPDAPSVTFAGRASPRVEVPTSTPPDRVLVDVITAGTGSVVAAGDQVTVNFKVLVWGSGKVVSETYGAGKKPVTFGTNDFLPGFTSALVGQKTGAQLLVAIPPEFGYGSLGSESAGVGGDDTLLVVIEIQSTKPS